MISSVSPLFWRELASRMGKIFGQNRLKFVGKSDLSIALAVSCAVGSMPAARTRQWAVVYTRMAPIRLISTRRM